MVQTGERYKSSIRSEYTVAGSSPACRTKRERQNIMEEQATYNRKHKYDVLIGIDPDVERSGYSVLDTRKMKMEMSVCPFPLLVEGIKKLHEHCKENDERVAVYVEAGWKNKSNWHLSPKDTRAIAAKKGEHVGRNQETGRKIVEMLRHYGIQVMEQSPLRKCWQGKDGKITHEELKRLCQMSGIEFNRPRSNQEERDSALLAITCSGLPIKYKVVESEINK